MSPAATCPVCGAALVPVARGFPDSDLWAAAERLEVVLGGCLAGRDEEEALSCPRCARGPVGNQTGLPRTVAGWYSRGEGA